MSKILITGATGYVGGTVLSQLLACTAPSVKDLTFSLLIRNDAQAQKLKDAYGSRINTIKWSGLNDTAFIEETASNYDIIINTGSGFIPEGAIAFVNGLARRVKAGKPTPWMLHLSGCTNLSDRPLTQPPIPLREWNDELDSAEILERMKALDEKEPYSQRTTEIGVLEAAAASGVQAVSINAPCIFGEGAGLFNRQGLVIPLIMMYVIQHGYGWKLNETANFDWVHVLDLADIYVLLVRAILEREDRGVGYISSGKRGVFFAAVGRTLIKEINQRCLDAAFADGVLPRDGTPKQKEIRLVPLEEIADKLTAGRSDIAERGWGGHKATKAVLARKLLGWEPKRLQEAWEKDFHDELVALKENRRMVTMESCIGATKR
ncbi:NAD(P)-binding protein [Trematosphaeria pertusa]|uniref:NAD(P)-binding protein n=1 Tax=Trematosphaeria pertusa TaxID=390896 RepID=A0A6A6IBX3_9PLEO|nr:NAD(P)-binding protein [Trematosphaeria pertusa]KAF2248074.1 NAD(P)-binding protein [Trematosphaeria pertusa]